jgi:Ser/Thr protein kinase RdoA (MazF antagonist)
MDDDADRGRRGLRPRLTPGLLRMLEDHYGMPKAAQPVDVGGSSSLNLLLPDGRNRRLVRVYRSYVTAARLGTIHHVRHVLSGAGVPTAPIIESRAGEPWVSWEGHLVEAEEYVEHDAAMNDWARLGAGMPLLARIHSLLDTVAVGEQGRRPLFANHIDPAEARSATRRAARRIRSWAPSPSELAVAAAAEQLAGQLAEAEAGLTACLPRQLVHGDFWDNNVGFRKGQLVLVADFDFMGERARIDDMALTLYFALSDLARGDLSAQTLRRVTGLVSRYDRNLDVRLSAEERAALPLAMARQPLWSIGGWVARLDDPNAARAHAAASSPALVTALRISAELDRWQDAFA